MRRLTLPFVLALAVLAAVTATAGATAYEPRIVNGQAAGAGEFPWQVALRSTRDYLYCGGTLIDATHVLTAEHCDVLVGENVYAGDRNRSGTTGQKDLVTAVKRHPLADATGDAPRYDINVLTLKDPVTDPDAAPISIVDTTSAGQALWDDGSKLTVSGWGGTQPRDPADETPSPLSQWLLWADVDRVSDRNCASVYGMYFSPADMMCAAGSNASGRTDTCQGDSGGPIVAPLSGGIENDRTTPAKWRLVGVTSWGAGCASPGIPGVYARLGAPILHDWLDTTAPTAPTLPAISGVPKVGQSLTCSGTASAPGAITYRFVGRDADGRTVQLAHTERPSYALTSGQAGLRVSCEIDVDDLAGSVRSPRSSETDAIRPLPAPTATAAPSLGGSTGVGSTLTCLPATWNGATSIARTIVRQAGGAETPVGNDAYVIGAADVGASFVCVEQASNADASAESRSTTVGPVPAPAADPAAAPPVPQPIAPRIAPDRDVIRPKITVVGRRCRARRCTVSLEISDDGGLKAVRATLRATRRRSRGRVLKAVRTARRYRIRTPRVSRGRYTLAVTAVDRTGNLRTTKLRLSVR